MLWATTCETLFNLCSRRTLSFTSCRRGLTARCASFARLPSWRPPFRWVRTQRVICSSGRRPSWPSRSFAASLSLAFQVIYSASPGRELASCSFISTAFARGSVTIRTLGTATRRVLVSVRCTQLMSAIGRRCGNCPDPSSGIFGDALPLSGFTLAPCSAIVLPQFSGVLDFGSDQKFTMQTRKTSAPKQRRQRTAAGHCDCNRLASWSLSLSFSR